MLASPSRVLYLIAYDIADHRRLARVHRYLLGWKVGGQKSFYECWMTPSELRGVMHGLSELIDPAADRVHIFQLDERMKPKSFGLANIATSQTFIIV